MRLPRLTPFNAQKPVAGAERKRKKGAAKLAAAGAAAGARDGREGKAAKKMKTHADGRGNDTPAPRRAADGERHGDGGRGGADHGGSDTAGRGAKSSVGKPSEPQRVSGKNLGRRRRAQVRLPAPESASECLCLVFFLHCRLTRTMVAALQAKREQLRAARKGAGGDAPAVGDGEAAQVASAERNQKKRERLAAGAAAAPTQEDERAAKKAQLTEKRRLQRAGLLVASSAGGSAPATTMPAAPAAPALKSVKATKPSLLEKANAQLAGGRFRWLNEALYTRDGRGAWELLSDQPAMFAEYHEGFRKQTAQWPRQPLDECIAWLHRCPATWAVADFGCGDARLAAAVPQATVHSFDLVAAAPGVVACDMCNVPLEEGTVQAAVFCLSLMGTDYGKALAEAHRVLAPRGALWIAEVRSRFEGADGGVEAFLRALAALGFSLRARDESDTMFAVFRFSKADEPGAKAPRWPALKACEYKRR